MSLSLFNAHRKSGFSLIEMIVAIVILGAIFTMALKGTTMVETMRAFMTGYQLQQFVGRVQIYTGQYNYLPGDDPVAPQRFHRDAAVYLLNGAPVSEVGNARIDGKLSDALSANGEQFMAWRDLRYANLLEGDATLVGASALPDNPFGGIFGFDLGNLGQAEPGSLCATKIPGGAAQEIDSRIDDGHINSGRVVATARFSIAAQNHFATPDTEPYDVDKEYIICLQLER